MTSGSRVIARLGVAILAISVAVAFTAASPRSACACSTKEKAYVAAMKADLRNMVVAQESYFADSGRYGTAQEFVVPERFVFSTGVELATLSVRADGFEARVRYPSGTPRECWLSFDASPGAVADSDYGEPQCTPAPTDTAHLYSAVAYAVLLLIAVAIRVTRAGSGLPPVGIGTLAGFLLLAVAHPFWQPIRERVACSLAPNFDILSLIAIGVITFWMIIRSDEDWESRVPA